MKPYYSDEWVTIYHGDCREVLVRPLVFDCIVSDPPYAIDVDVGKLNRIGKPTYGEWHGVEHSGGVDIPLLLSFDLPTVLFGANCYADRLPAHGGWIVWDKQTDGFAHGSPAELAWTNCLRNLRMFRLNYRGFTTRNDPKYHPMQKPVQLMAWILGLEGLSAGTVCDPYMGAGSTLVAARNANRKAIGIEIEERYCEMAVQRCSQGVLDLRTG